MWQSAGLHISHTGYILPSNRPETQKPMGDDMISNALIWLTMKLVNFIAAGDDFPHELGLGIRQKQLLEYWESLERQLNAWYDGLPESFRPTSTVWPDRAEVRICENITVSGAKVLTMGYRSTRETLLTSLRSGSHAPCARRQCSFTTLPKFNCWQTNHIYPLDFPIPLRLVQRARHRRAWERHHLPRDTRHTRRSYTTAEDTRRTL